MTNLIQNYSVLIPLAPLAAGLLTALPAVWIGRKVYRIGVLAHLLAFGLAVAVLRDLATTGRDAVRIPLFPSPWSGVAGFDFSIDRLAAVMMVLITGIGTLIYLYSVQYMKSERGQRRFHTLLAFAVFALLCMVSSANLLMLFLFWQLMSWLLSLLAYNHEHLPTVKGAFRTFMILRLGDLFFLAGIVLAYGLYGTLDFDLLFDRASASPITFAIFGTNSGIEIGAASTVALLIFVGAMSKSAQVPLHMWVPDSLYAPTPVSALLHAGIINAGGFLLNRLAPLYGLSPAVLHAVFLVGLLTAFLGASMMLVQNDIKETLGYSTIGQMGYMIMECGLGAFALAVFHLIAHGMFKATMFLHCGNVIHLARKDPRLPSKDEPDEEAEFSLLTWLTGFAITLILPLVILMAAHGVLNIPLRDSQGTVIFLFFSWVTSSQAILTLYRIRAVASRKVAALMLLTFLLVVSTYLLAAETFTYFLYPAPGLVGYYFRAAALPVWVFDFMILGMALLVVVGWILIYARSHGRSIRMTGAMAGWAGALQTRLYLFFMNRLYMDALLLLAGRGLVRLGHRLARSRFLPPFLSLIALGVLVRGVYETGGMSVPDVAVLVFSAFLLPLFPFHGAYVAVLSRWPGSLPTALAFLMPTAGYYGLVYLRPDWPPEVLGAIRLLSLLGALYGSFKAVMQTRLDRLLAYAGLALFSILWWHLAVAGSPTPQAGIYAVSLALASSGLFFASRCLRARYGASIGGVDTSQIGGLARPMPRFAVLLVLLVMGAVGLPPFGIFSGFVSMLLQPTGVRSLIDSYVLSGDLMVILIVWFSASWYLFRMMQHLLFGPNRPDLIYEDLRPGEVFSLVILLGALVGLGLFHSGTFETARLSDAYRTAQGWSPWNR
jgi:NADH-quinone oxidoreductase subunit L